MKEIKFSKPLAMQLGVDKAILVSFLKERIPNGEWISMTPLEIERDLGLYNASTIRKRLRSLVRVGILKEQKVDKRMLYAFDESYVEEV